MFSGIKLLIPISFILIVSVAAAYIASGSYIASLPYLMIPTAHAAFAFFWMAFSASGIHSLAPSSYSKWAMKNRRYIGLSFALIHTAHLILIMSNIAFTDIKVPMFVLISGGIAYVLMFLMALTSNNYSVKKLGAQNWKWLHTIGSWYIWAIFMSALPEVLAGRYNRIWIFTLGFVVLAIRIVAHRKRKMKRG